MKPAMIAAFQKYLFEELEVDLKCARCDGVVVSPVRNSCSHLFCEKCISTITKCPESGCYSPIVNYHVDFTFKRLTEQLSVMKDHFEVYNKGKLFSPLLKVATNKASSSLLVSSTAEPPTQDSLSFHSPILTNAKITSSSSVVEAKSVVITPLAINLNSQTSNDSSATINAPSTEQLNRALGFDYNKRRKILLGALREENNSEFEEEKPTSQSSLQSTSSSSSHKQTVVVPFALAEASAPPPKTKMVLATSMLNLEQAQNVAKFAEDVKAFDESVEAKFAPTLDCDLVLSQPSLRPTHIVFAPKYDEAERKVYCAMSLKYLIGVSCGARMVSYEWVVACMREKRLLPTEKFEVDVKPERPRVVVDGSGLGFGRFLEGWTIYLGSFASGAVLSKNDVKGLLQLNGACVVDIGGGECNENFDFSLLPQDKLGEKSLILIGHDNDNTNAHSLRQEGVPIKCLFCSQLKSALPKRYLTQGKLIESSWLMICLLQKEFIEPSSRKLFHG